MSATTEPDTDYAIVYPDSDGKRMADNTLQFSWIVTIQGGFDALYRDDPNVFVAGDLLWYPVKGQPKIRLAPDTLIAFGRPKGYRGSYIQHREGGVAPQVVFEVRSPKNTRRELAHKHAFYERFGVEEYYLYDPEGGTLEGWLRDGPALRPILAMQGWVSPRTGVRFALDGLDLVLTRPDGRRFKSFLELEEERDRAERDRQAAEARAAQERLDRQVAEARAAQERLDRQAAEARAARLAERLRALGVDPDA